MARIDEFYQGPNRYDVEALKHDLLGKILEEHVEWENGITHRELCHYYLDPYPIHIEDRLLISNILQGARYMMQDAGWFLDVRGGRWFAVKTTEAAYHHILRYARREINLHRRLQTKTHIGVGDRYQIPANNPLIQAIEGTTPAIEQLEEAVDNPEPPGPPQLEEGHENQD